MGWEERERMEKLVERYLKWILGMEDTRIFSKRGDIKGEERGQGNVHGISKKG